MSAGQSKGRRSDDCKEMNKSILILCAVVSGGLSLVGCADHDQATTTSTTTTSERSGTVGGSQSSSLGARGVNGTGGDVSGGTGSYGGRP